MKTSSRILSIIMAVMLAGAMTACGAGKNVETSDDAVSVSEAAQSDAELDTVSGSDINSDEGTSAGSDADKKDTDSKKSSSKSVSSKNASSKKTSSKAASSKAASSKAASSKAASSKAASSKSTSSQAASSGAQNPAAKFEGNYATGRAAVKVEAKGSSSAEITVSWSDSAASYVEWVMSGEFDAATRTVEYDDCTKTYIVMNSDGSIGSEDIEYRKGEGRVMFFDDQTLIWEDDEENIAEGMVFEYYKNQPDDSDYDGYLTKDEAIAKVRERAGSGAEIVSAFKGYAPDGLEAWVITVEPVTTADGAQNVTYYVGYLFCYTDESSDSDDGYISEDEALASVRQQAGAGAQITEWYKGYTPDGYEAWVVTVIPAAAEDDSETVTYYSGYAFCYSE